MKKRLAKKLAKRYFEGTLPFNVVEEEFQAFNDGRKPVIKVMASVHPAVGKEVLAIAHSKGWDGCHWTSPLLLDVRP